VPRSTSARQTTGRDIDVAPLRERRCFGPPPPAARRLQVACCTIVVTYAPIWALLGHGCQETRHGLCPANSRTLPLSGHACLETGSGLCPRHLARAPTCGRPETRRSRGGGCEPPGNLPPCGQLRRVCALPNNPNMHVPKLALPSPPNQGLGPKREQKKRSHKGGDMTMRPAGHPPRPVLASANEQTAGMLPADWSETNLPRFPDPAEEIIRIQDNKTTHVS